MQSLCSHSAGTAPSYPFFDPGHKRVGGKSRNRAEETGMQGLEHRCNTLEGAHCWGHPAPTARNESVEEIQALLDRGSCTAQDFIIAPESIGGFVQPGAKDRLTS